MNFDDAVKAHSEWKSKLSRYIEHPDHSLKPSEVTIDTNCALGKWIESDGRKHAALPEFTRLKAEHQRFHKAAAGIITKVDAGADETKEVALGAKSEFSEASAAVVTAIMAMKAKAGH